MSTNGAGYSVGVFWGLEIAVLGGKGNGRYQTITHFNFITSFVGGNGRSLPKNWVSTNLILGFILANMEVKQNASLDASFWINMCAASLAQFVPDYFSLFVNTVVAQEIRYPFDALGIAAQTTVLFNRWVQSGKITLQEPTKSVDWFQEGENAAIALAIEHDYFLLIDDANPYHRAKAAGLKVVGSSEFIILLYDHELINNETAVAAIKQTHASKKQKRLALVTLETLKRFKEN